jgi:hypothetical protein
MKTRPAVALAGLVLSGCGLNVQSPDLFKVTRTGAGRPPLTLLVNDGGTISCNGGKPKTLPDRQLLAARDLAERLNDDVKLHFPHSARSVFTYTVKVPKGTFTFPDVVAATRKELSDLELFVVQAAADPCGIPA